MQTARGVDNHVVGRARLGRLQSVEQHRRRIAARLVLDDLGPGAFAPNLQLLNSGSAKRVSRGQQHSLTLRAQQVGQLADGGCLAGPIHSHDQNHFRLAVHFLHRPLVGGVEDGEQLFLEQPLQFVNVRDLFAIHFVTQGLQDSSGGCGAQVGRKQRRFQIVEGFAIDFLAEGNHVFDAFAKAFTRARDRLFHAFEKTGLFFRIAK